MQTATTSSSGTVLPFGAVLPSHALDAHLRRIERARDAAATSVRNPSCENLRQLWNNNDRASHAACEPVLWKVFQEITDASSSFNLSGLSDASSGTTHQFHKRPMQATAFRRMLQLAASSTSPLARGIYDNNMAPWAQSTRMDIRPIRTVCEVGFNAGHSAALWLENTAVEHLHSFDVLDHPYSKAQVELVSRLYPGRFTMHGGDSRRTLPQFASQLKSMPVHERSPQHGSLCDLWYIDGGHVGVLPAADMGNAIRSSHKARSWCVTTAQITGLMSRTRSRSCRSETSSGIPGRSQCFSITRATRQAGALGSSTKPAECARDVGRRGEGRDARRSKLKDQGREST